MILSLKKWLMVIALLMTVSTSVVAKDNPVLIGLDADMSAVAQEGGIAIKRGAQIAIDEINAKGGVLGRPLKLSISDHRGNPARGKYNLKKHIKNEDVVAVLGGVHTPVVLQQLALIHEHSIPFLVPWAAGTPIIDNGYNPNFVFRVSVRDSEAADVLIRNAKADGHKRIGLLLEQTGWGRSNERSLLAAANKYDLQVSQIGWFNWRQPSMKNELARIKASEATAIVLVANAPEGATIANEMATNEQLAELSIYSHWGIASGKFVKDVGLDKLSKLQICVLQTYSFAAPYDHVKNDFVLDQYRKMFDEKATEKSIQSAVGVAHAYDLVHLLALAIEKTGSTDRRAIRDSLETIPSYQGLVKAYSPPFSADRHDSLFSVDYFLATYDKNGNLIPKSNAEK